MTDGQTETIGKRGFWDFCSEHPVAFVLAVVLAVVAVTSGTADVAQAISGNHPPDDGFWKYNGKCTERMK